ncbi:immunoglobulin superfamily member 5 isoform X1 [Triplophysa dalaica]|uniref:immunoglobulin superfamily member 5 isoform X1 n=1 Tax=Triplophysa dalaica TaxID=1582913 RepID=UPI0024DF9013|nr:immunoglobulin superfamily member 5 isoform X1 [Triplophysa dalaica]
MHGYNLQLNLLLCTIQTVASFIQLEPMVVTVLRDSAVHFNCSTNESWDVMTWLLDGRTILTISVHHGPLGSDEIVSTLNHSTSALSVWELILMNAPFKPKAQEVRCEFLPTKSSRPSSTLFVQENGNVSILEGDLSAQEGTLVMFHCQAMGWYPSPTVSWAMSYIAVDRSDFNTSDLQDPDGLFNSISVLQIKAEMSTTVECQVSAAPAHQTSSIKLTVVQPETTQDYMAVIAVTVIVCTVVLLVALVLILYYKRKLTKTALKNTFSSSSPWTVNLDGIETSVAGETRGKINRGYHAEDATGSGHSDLSNRADSMTNITSPPRHTSQNQTQGGSNLYSKEVKTVRRVTTV